MRPKPFSGGNLSRTWALPNSTPTGGIAALLTMVNSCANGVATVNIDNGFGAGYLASQINLAISKTGHQQ